LIIFLQFGLERRRRRFESSATDLPALIDAEEGAKSKAAEGRVSSGDLLEQYESDLKLQEGEGVRPAEEQGEIQGQRFTRDMASSKGYGII